MSRHRSRGGGHIDKPDLFIMVLNSIVIHTERVKTISVEKDDLLSGAVCLIPFQQMLDILQRKYRLPPNLFNLFYFHLLNRFRLIQVFCFPYHKDLYLTLSNLFLMLVMLQLFVAFHLNIKISVHNICLLKSKNQMTYFSNECHMAMMLWLTARKIVIQGICFRSIFHHSWPHYWWRTLPLSIDFLQFVHALFHEAIQESRQSRKKTLLPIHSIGAKSIWMEHMPGLPTDKILTQNINIIILNFGTTSNRHHFSKQWAHAKTAPHIICSKMIIGI